jgi:phosphoribosylanthranilate isomerase
MFVKICGITRKNDYEFLKSVKADAAGFIAYAKSSRYISAGEVRRIISPGAKIIHVGVFVDADFEFIKTYIDAGINTVQLHGNESPELAVKISEYAEVWKAMRARTKQDVIEHKGYPAKKFLVDSFSSKQKGGTGKTADWNLASFAVKTLEKPVLLAGGLKASNIAEALKRVHPFGIDLSSGTEISPGIKSHRLIKNVMKTAEEAFDEKQP